MEPRKGKCLYFLLISLPFFSSFFFKPHFHPESSCPVFSENWKIRPLICVSAIARELAGEHGFKAALSEHPIFPLVRVSEHVCVPLFREENITKTLPNYCWPFITLELLQPRNEHPCLGICPFSLWGDTSSPRAY